MTTPGPAPDPAPADDAAAAPAGLRHTWYDDAFGLASGCILVGVGIVLLKSGELVTGGIPGLALLMSYAVALPLPLLILLGNLPFFVLAAFTRGWRFTLRTVIATVSIAVTTALSQLFIRLEHVDMVWAAISGSLIAGSGLLIVFRHGSSVGGFSVVALWLQERFGLRAGVVLMTLDGLVVLAAFAVTDPLHVLVSAGGAVLLSLVIALNHKPGRYAGY